MAEDSGKGDAGGRGARGARLQRRGCQGAVGRAEPSVLSTHHRAFCIPPAGGLWKGEQAILEGCSQVDRKSVV